VIILGHRGGRGAGWPAENSLAALQRALDEGADGVELDVRLSADGTPVLVHDPLTKDGRYVYRVNAGDLPTTTATLDDALDLLAGRVVNVELKSDVPSRRALARTAVSSVMRARRSEVVFSSFDPFLVLACAALAPGVARAILVGERTERLATALPIGMRSMVVAAHLQDPLVTTTRVVRLARRGLRVCAWTVNDVERARELAGLGIEWLITDKPGSMVAAKPSLVAAAPRRKPRS
jgi:glycerophosphoryl diester phosphodiesterase